NPCFPSPLTPHPSTPPEPLRRRRIFPLQPHLLRQIPRLLPKRIPRRRRSAGGGPTRTAADVPLKQVRRFRYLRIYPLLERHRSHAVFAGANGLAVGLVGDRRPLHDPKYSPSAGRNVRESCGTKTAFSRCGEYALVNLDI